ncbi:leucyl/phenylalanyl-tRNA--protein transferase [Raineyella fluvialis]|uniref:Leucyl/phenylalanyl-tRNA--protein transferase n=1 Tax=Raineyella fluvialis TaxID=2662261 RepID=A0A5Q2F7N4_9ACTN|nr:leucyl/phenylalanyl-tRNA--protein transferase [Raineyella fluvialis]QGF22932.1 leucyl/phenylalanyl-tRNA--protein transferase [Raineyella fluvialis]
MARPYLDPAPLPGPGQWADQDLVALTIGMDAPLVMRAYVNGMFPMPISEDVSDELPPADWIGWFSPVARGILPLEELRVPRSLRKSAKHFEVSVDRDFAAVLAACGGQDREGGWIDESVVAVYSELHRAGRAHSVEAWTPDGRLAGGLYGVGYGGLFAGESMFHDPVIGRDASKVALMGLVAMLAASGDADRRLLDVQWRTEHLASLGVVEVSREDYLRRLRRALALPLPRWRIPDDWRTVSLGQ